MAAEQSQVTSSFEVPTLRKRARALWILAKRNPLGAVGAVLGAGFIFMAIFAPLLSLHGPYTINQTAIMQGPSASHAFGTDYLGRDVLSRVFFGSRISLVVGFAVILSAKPIGAAIGIVAAYYGGKLDLVVQRVVDAMMSFPSLLFALVLVTVLTPSLGVVIFAIAVLQIPGTSRIIRAQALGVKGQDYVTAAKALGASSLRILVVHITPQCIAPLLVLSSLSLPQAIITESSLSFLGLGIPAPAPSWGNMLSEARPYLESAPWIAIAPGVMISLAVFGFNMLGDAMRDILDPRLRGSR